jgi:RimJ/RimL family protein N-acetyltransferase
MFESDQLVLQPLTPKLAEAIAAGDSTGQSWAPDYPTPGDVRIAAYTLAGHSALASEATPWGLFVIVDRPSGLVVGGIGFKGPPDQRGEVEIGYGICDSFQGRGLATEAVAAMCEIARSGAQAVVAETERANVASQRVLEKSGFHCANPADELIRWRKEILRSDV